MRRVVAAATAAALLVACSGGPQAGNPQSVTSRPTAAEPVATTVAVPSTTAPATSASTTTTTTPTTAPPTTVADSAEWCRHAVALNELATRFKALDAADTDAVRATLAAILEQLDLIEPLAPLDLADPFVVSADAFRLLEVALAEVDYDLARADLSDVEQRTDEISAANRQIRTYNQATCGLDAGVTGEEVP